MGNRTSHIFGHAVVWRNVKWGSGWHYRDTGVQHVSREGVMCGTEAREPRACPLCGRYPTAEGHDPCIANLPGVAYACCGHGVHEGYVSFDNGSVVRGWFSRLPK